MRTSLSVSSIIRILGRLLLIEALLMLLPLAVCLIYGESDWFGFAVAIVAAAVAGGVAELSTRSTGISVRSREGFIITALVWVVFGLFGMLPFLLSATPLGFTDAMFEVISGFTTTGASMITDVEAQSHGILFWRAFTQWIGGLGIIFFMLAVLPELNQDHRNIHVQCRGHRDNPWEAPSAHPPDRPVGLGGICHPDCGVDIAPVGRPDESF